jgi:hypothetical protein
VLIFRKQNERINSKFAKSSQLHSSLNYTPVDAMKPISKCACRTVDLLFHLLNCTDSFKHSRSLSSTTASSFALASSTELRLCPHGCHTHCPVSDVRKQRADVLQRRRSNIHTDIHENWRNMLRIYRRL